MLVANFDSLSIDVLEICTVVNFVCQILFWLLMVTLFLHKSVISVSNKKKELMGLSFLD